MSLLNVTNDYVFKRIFGQKKNSDILKDLLQAILTDIEITSVHVRCFIRKAINDRQAWNFRHCCYIK